MRRIQLAITDDDGVGDGRRYDDDKTFTSGRQDEETKEEATESLAEGVVTRPHPNAGQARLSIEAAQLDRNRLTGGMRATGSCKPGRQQGGQESIEPTGETIHVWVRSEGSKSEPAADY